MKKLMLILVAVAFVSMTFGCSGTTETPDNNTDMPIPDWFLNPDLEPGVAIYGAGVYTMDSPNELKLAKTSAAADARREIADAMKVTIQAVLKSYQKKIVTDSNKKKFESLVTDVMRQITNNEIYGAKVVKTKTENYNGQILVFCLVRIGFDSIAKVMSDANRKEFESVEAAAAEAFDDMDRLLREQTEKPHMLKSAEGYVPNEAPAPK